MFLPCHWVLVIRVLGENTPLLPLLCLLSVGPLGAADPPYSTFVSSSLRGGWQGQQSALLGATVVSPHCDTHGWECGFLGACVAIATMMLHFCSAFPC